MTRYYGVFDLTESIRYRDATINCSVHAVEGLAAFYREHFGFVETFRTPPNGTAVHIEVRLGYFVLGLASIDTARSMHQLPLNPGLPGSDRVCRLQVSGAGPGS